MEDEEKERKRAERKARDKETAYQVSWKLISGEEVFSSYGYRYACILLTQFGVFRPFVDLL
jgi:hypothetical protein